jgi:hypothetical protein
MACNRQTGQMVILHAICLSRPICHHAGHALCSRSAADPSWVWATSGRQGHRYAAVDGARGLAAPSGLKIWRSSRPTRVDFCSRWRFQGGQLGLSKTWPRIKLWGSQVCRVIHCQLAAGSAAPRQPWTAWCPTWFLACGTDILAMV